jgi:hypothetical protein
MHGIELICWMLWQDVMRSLIEISMQICERRWRKLDVNEAESITATIAIEIIANLLS